MNRISAYIIISIILVLGMLSQEANAKNKKIHICHKGQVIEVSVNALDAHINHGDKVAEETTPGVWVCPDPNKAPDPGPCYQGTIPDGCWDWDASSCKWVSCCTNPWTGLPCECKDDFGDPMPCIPPGVPGETACWDGLQWVNCCTDDKGNTYPCMIKP